MWTAFNAWEHLKLKGKDYSLNMSQLKEECIKKWTRLH